MVYEFNIRERTLEDSKMFLEFINQLDIEAEYMLFEEGERNATLESIRKNTVKTIEDGDICYIAIYNNKIVGPDNHELLNIVEYKDNHEIIGGLLGGTYWGWLYISILWVDEKYRHQGIGKKLIAEAKQEAEKRGCKYAHVDTMSFQAPKFYKKTSL